MSGKHQRSKGAVALAGKGSQAKIARKIGVSKGAVCQWISGLKLPGAANRIILEERYGIPRAWWDEPAPEPAAPSTCRCGVGP